MTPTQSSMLQFAPSEGGGNIFLGGQCINHFYATPTCVPMSFVPCYSPSFVPGVIHSGPNGASTSLGSEPIEVDFGGNSLKARFSAVVGYEIWLLFVCPPVVAKQL
ncbi:hypothetical protein AHAS_Ahas13G0332500 [Arachis hypogaea]